MTTIAVKDGVMATDSMVVDGGVAVGEKCKVAEIDCGFLAVSGPALALNEVAKWLKSFPDVQGEAPKSLDGASGLLLLKSGDVFQIESGAPYVMKADFFAIGSGYQIAIGAMAMGASAELAVKVASQFDTNTGGEIRVFGVGA